MMRRLFSLAVFCVPTLASAAIINVPADQPTIQAGIDAAMTGDEVVVAPGFYLESLNTNGKAITIRSQDPEDPEVVGDTQIIYPVDGNQDSRIFTIDSGEGRDTVISGFYFEGGFADDSSGGVFLLDGTSPTIRNCNFINNDAEVFGGSIAVLNGGDPLIERCHITNSFISFQDGEGALIAAIDSSATFRNCVIYGSSCNGPSCIYASNATMTFVHCEYRYFSQVSGFLAIKLENGSGLEFLNSYFIVTGAAECDFSQCDVHSVNGDSTLTLKSCRFDGNIIGSVTEINPIVGPIGFEDGFPTPDSVIIDAGDNALVPADLTVDFYGNPRIANGTVDVGAIELPSALCAGDCDGSGTVDFNDLVSMLFEFGNSGEARCDADESGMVDFNDLVAALFLFGPCP